MATVDRQALRSFVQTHGDPLWRALVATTADPATAERSLIGAVAALAESARGSAADGEGPNRVDLWSAAFSQPGLDVSSDSDASTEDREPARPGAAIHPSLLDVGDALVAVTPTEARLLLARHVGRFDDHEAGRFASMTTGRAADSLARAEAELRLGPTEPPERWTALLAEVPTPDLDAIIDRAVADQSWWRPAALGGAALLLAVVVAFLAGRSRLGPDIERADAPAGGSLSACRAAAPAAAAGFGTLNELLFRTDLVASARVVEVSATETGLRVRVENVVSADPRPLSTAPLPTSLDLPVQTSPLARTAENGLGQNGENPLDHEALVFLQRSADGWRSLGDDGVVVACGDDIVTLAGRAPNDDTGTPIRSLADLQDRVDAVRADQTVLELAATDTGQAEGGIVIPDGRRLWLRWPDATSVEQLAVRAIDANGSDRVELRGPGLAIRLRPARCVDGAPSASVATGSVASLAAGAITMCLTEPGLAVDVDIEGGSRPEMLGRLAALIAPADPDVTPDSPTHVHSPGPGWIVGLDPTTFEPRWSSRQATSTSLEATTDRRVILAAADDELIALDRTDGTTAWRTEATAVRQITADPTGNVLYLVEGDGGPSALDPVLALRDGATGLRRWIVPTPAGVSRSIVGATPGAVLLDRRTDVGGSSWSVSAIADSNGEPVELWRIDDATSGAGSGTGSGRPAQALTDDERGVLLVLGPERLLRFDLDSGGLRWQTSIGPDPQLTLSGIWANTATLSTGDRTLTVSLTDGTFLPP